jgi:hypothetical protein
MSTPTDTPSCTPCTPGTGPAPPAPRRSSSPGGCPHRLAQRVRAAPGRVLLLQRHHERGAHRARVQLPAHRHPVALLDRHGPSRRPPSSRRTSPGRTGSVPSPKRRLSLIRAPAGRSSPGSSGSPDRTRRFTSRCRSMISGPNISGRNSLREPVAVLPRERATELHDQLGDVPRDRLHPPDVLAPLQVQVDADVQAPLPGMPEEAQGGPVPVRRSPRSAACTRPASPARCPYPRRTPAA